MDGEKAVPKTTSSRIATYVIGAIVLACIVGMGTGVVGAEIITLAVSAVGAIAALNKGVLS